MERKKRMRRLTDKVMDRAAKRAAAWTKENTKKTGNNDVARWAFEAGYRACHAEGPALTPVECVVAAKALAKRFGGVADNYGEIMHIVLKTLEDDNVLR